ncbi:hypothetical protein NVV99_25490 [Rhodococcus sp. PAE-6]|uniref:hypothetical protein n=1 Tax=Rhodococcus TaxID=1827 RepID=UPI001E4AA26C|nr:MULTISPECIES: hypothetical protein [Rhodococcus]MCT7294246.1 hypothetical protein [Rhodococcus sp. PAE-6]MCW3471752.1 hypothetical protein [Rhodococcus pyridinivorans]UGQ60464.1 hypothetical protein LSF60_23275 [Rhodococcus pyridinivorans]
MGLSPFLARLAVQATRVLVVEAPGQWATRMELEQQLLRRGWRIASSPAQGDVLVVCGAPGPELSDLANRLWEQMPGPRVRIGIASPGAVVPALDNATAHLLDTSHHRTDARERAQEPSMSDHANNADGEGHVGHEGHEEHQGHGGHSDHEEHADRQAHEGHEDHGGHGGHEGHADHGGHEGHEGHGDMDMAPAGIPLAEGGEDRDGLEMDVLHLPLGPVLPFWPAGLVLHCSLQGDVVVGATASVIDATEHRAGAPGRPTDHASATVTQCDQVMALLALAGAEDLADCARRARDGILTGDPGAARDAVERLHRKVRRSRLLRWSLRGVLPLGPADLERHGLPGHCLGDAHDRLLAQLERIRVEVGGATPDRADGGSAQESADKLTVPWAVVPDLVTGLELGTVRLAVASLDLGSHPAVREVGHV